LFELWQVGSTPDLMVAYIDFFLGGDEKRLDVASTIQKRFPMCLIFGGDGSYMSPYYLHSDTLLSNLLGQVNSDFADDNTIYVWDCSSSRKFGVGGAGH
jgi:hypothetical protein